MSKRNIIIIVVLVILIGAAAGYYFLYFTEDSDPLTEDVNQIVEQDMEDQGETSETEGESEESPDPEESSDTIEDLVEEQELKIDERYAYREELRNPFGNMAEQETEIKVEEITFPFRLDGIISNGNQRIAVLTTTEGPRFINSNQMIGEYYISSVGEEQIRINYKYFTVYMKIGGALVE